MDVPVMGPQEFEIPIPVSTPQEAAEIGVIEHIAELCKVAVHQEIKRRVQEKRDSMPVIQKSNKIQLPGAG